MRQASPIRRSSCRAHAFRRPIVFGNLMIPSCCEGRRAEVAVRTLLAGCKRRGRHEVWRVHTMRVDLACALHAHPTGCVPPGNQLSWQQASWQNPNCAQFNWGFAQSTTAARLQLQPRHKVTNERRAGCRCTAVLSTLCACIQVRRASKALARRGGGATSTCPRAHTWHIRYCTSGHSQPVPSIKCLLSHSPPRSRSSIVHVGGTNADQAGNSHANKQH